MSSDKKDQLEPEQPPKLHKDESPTNTSRLPPFRVDDTNLLLYDVLLLINLVVSLSVWVVHRLDMNYLWPSLSEGCVLSVCWIVAGLSTGSFLYSALDGHNNENNSGPPSAALLAMNTYMNTVSLRIVLALTVAILQHRTVGSGAGEEFLSLELGFGLLLMSLWRALYSRFVPRV